MRTATDGVARRGYKARSIGALGALLALVGAGCGHLDRDRILTYVGASFEGGIEVALIEQRVWSRVAACDEVVWEDNELRLVWSHSGRPGEYGDWFEIGERLDATTTHVAARGDGAFVYYSFGSLAEVADRFGNVAVELGEDMGAAAFLPSGDDLLVEGPSSLWVVDLVERSWYDLEVDGHDPSVAPDGEWAVYGRDGRVYVYDLTFHEEHGLGDGLWPRFRDDGLVIAYRDGEHGPGIYAVEPGHSGWSLVGLPDDAVIEAPWRRLAPDGQRVLFDDGAGRYQLSPWSAPSDDDWWLASELACD